MFPEPAKSAELLHVAEHLFRRCQSLGPINHYYGLLSIYGLCVTAENKADAALTAECNRILSAFPDGVAHPDYNFPAYRIGGIPRAYQFFRRHLTDESTRKLLEHYVDEMMHAPRDSQGILCHPKASAEAGLIWIDVAMAVTPFLLFAGLGLDRPDCVAEAAKQAFLMYDVFQDPYTGLLHQCRGFIGPNQFSTDHWSRGNGWGIIALTELVQHLPPTSPHLTLARGLMKRHLDALLPWQNERGLWLQELSAPQDPRNWEETSGSALILYALGTALRCGVVEGAAALEAFHRGIGGLLQFHIDDEFSTSGCCHGCLAPGNGLWRGTPEAYMTECSPVKDEPHSFGPFMLALNSAARLSS